LRFSVKGVNHRLIWNQYCNTTGTRQKGTLRRPQKRGSPHILLTDYLEQLGVEGDLGLCGHPTRHPHSLTALGKEPVSVFIFDPAPSRLRHMPPMGTRAAVGQAGRVAHSPRAGSEPMRRPGVANAALDSIPMVVIAGGRCHLPLLRPAIPHQEDQSPHGWRISSRSIVLSLQTHIPGGSAGGSSANCRTDAVSFVADRGAPAPCWWNVPMDIFFGRPAGRRLPEDSNAGRAYRPLTPAPCPALWTALGRGQAVR